MLIIPKQVVYLHSAVHIFHIAYNFLKLYCQGSVFSSRLTAGWPSESHSLLNFDISQQISPIPLKTVILIIFRKEVAVKCVTSQSSGITFPKDRLLLILALIFFLAILFISTLQLYPVFITNSLLGRRTHWSEKWLTINLKNNLILSGGSYRFHFLDSSRGFRCTTHF